MHLSISKSKNKTFYYVISSFREGDKVTSKRILKIGEHSELLAQIIQTWYQLDEFLYCSSYSFFSYFWVLKITDISTDDFFMISLLIYFFESHSPISITLIPS